MWPWIKRWRDWAMHDFWFMHRIGPQPQALHYSYEKAGLTVHDQPVPWNAEVVVVEASLRLPPSGVAPRRKTDFQLLVPGHGAIPAESLRKADKEDRHHLFFRIQPTPAESLTVQLRWHKHTLGTMTIPVVSREEFVQKLRLHQATMFIRLGDQSVACHTFVSTQCRGLMASALVTSPTSLVPLLDLGLQVEFRPERGGAAQTVPVQFASSQLADRQALCTVVPRSFPRRIGAWTATWLVGDTVLATQHLRAISQRHFHRSLRVSDTRFVVMTKKNEVLLTRQLPPLHEVRWVRPCFLLSSREPGMAGLCKLQVRAQTAGGNSDPALALQQEVLLTDGPTWFAPGTEDAAGLDAVTAFELRLKSETLGLLSLSPIPEAVFTGEGGFKPPGDFGWSVVADDELNDRLTRLLDRKPGED
ncbi:MAG TPA: hypothetical protein VFA18_00725 [Gemmataceae bacterium]|nr:hypothetical protein [Gemmataceae bacterium]